MPDQTTILSLPLILPAQAQKHVTHNEALRLLDVMVQLTVQDRNRTAAPASPSLGARHIVAAGAVGDWAGQDGRIALWEGTSWAFIAPLTGWRAHVVAEGAEASYDDGVWATPAEGTLQVAQLGVSASADATNRLAVASAAILLNHAGAGHQIKVNKATAIDTASLLFQTGFSGRAEMGTTGNDDFTIKVSANGVTYFDALRVAGGSGVVSAVAGLRLPGGVSASPALSFNADSDTGMTNPAANQIALVTGGVQRAVVSGAGLAVTGQITGTAVTQGGTDATSGRLMKVGDFGLGGTAPQAPASITTTPETIAPGVYSYSTSFSAGGPEGVINGTMWHLRRAAGVYTQIVIGDWPTPALGQVFSRAFVGGAWGAWLAQYSSGNLLGTVAQTSGVPSGSVIERGTNANGDYVRFADRSQICTRSMAASSTATTTWTFPAAFAVAPSVTGTAVATVQSAICLDAAPTAISANFSARSKTDARRADTTFLIAVGRWF